MRHTHVKFHFLIALLFGLLGLNASNVWAQTIDRGTQRNGMHSCPAGQFVVGVRVDRNLLLCSGEFGLYTRAQEIVQSGRIGGGAGWDIETQSHGMHACPEGMAITGLHVSRNLLACAPVARPPIPRFVDAGTQRSGMHACRAGNPASGIHVRTNLLLCGTQHRLRILSFDAAPHDIRRGEIATIRWDVDCTAPDCSVHIEHLSRSALPLRGSERVTPPVDDTYTLTAESGGGRVSDTTWVRVAAAASRDRGGSSPTESTFTVWLGANVPYTGFPWWTGRYPTIGTLDGNLTRVANPRNSVWLGFLKREYGSVDCGNPNAYVLLRPGDTMTEEQMRQLFGSSRPPLPISFVACSGAVGQPRAGGGLDFPALPLNITYTRRR